MAKTFNRDPNRKRIVTETEMSEPETVFELKDFENKSITTDTTQSSTRKAGRPKKNKVYSTVRLQKNTVNRINALQNSLNFETQDDIVCHMLDKLENSLDTEFRTVYEMYMRTYKARDEKKNKK